MSKGSEASLQKALMQYGALRGLVLHRRNVGAGKFKGDSGKDYFVKFSTVGESDLWGIQPGTGRHVEIECKAPGKKPTPAQTLWINGVRALGGLAFCVDNFDEGRHLIDCIAENNFGEV